jgi:hypothetical protein
LPVNIIRVTLALRLSADCLGRALFITNHATLTVIVIDVGKILRVQTHGGLRTIEIAKEATLAFGEIDFWPLRAPIAGFA